MWSYSLLAKAELYLTVSESKYSCKWQRGSLNANTRVYVCTVDSYCDWKGQRVTELRQLMKEKFNWYNFTCFDRLVSSYMTITIILYYSYTAALVKTCCQYGVNILNLNFSAPKWPIERNISEIPNFRFFTLGVQTLASHRKLESTWKRGKLQWKALKQSGQTNKWIMTCVSVSLNLNVCLAMNLQRHDNVSVFWTRSFYFSFVFTPQCIHQPQVCSSGEWVSEWVRWDFSNCCCCLLEKNSVLLVIPAVDNNRSIFWNGTLGAVDFL